MKGREIMNDELQVRYVVVSNSEEVEVAFEDLTDKEREEIADRLEREAMADKMHADALERYRQRKFGVRPDEDTSGETKH